MRAIASVRARTRADPTPTTRRLQVSTPCPAGCCKSTTSTPSDRGHSPATVKRHRSPPAKPTSRRQDSDNWHFRTATSATAPRACPNQRRRTRRFHSARDNAASSSAIKSEANSTATPAQTPTTTIASSTDPRKAHFRAFDTGSRNQQFRCPPATMVHDVPLFLPSHVASTSSGPAMRPARLIES